MAARAKKTKKSWITPEGEKLLKHVKKVILEHPEKYRQDVYNCGSACCIAGHVVMEGIPRTMLDVRREYGSYEPYVLDEIQQWDLLAMQLLVGNKSDHYFDAYVNLFSGDPENYWPEPFATQWRLAAVDQTKQAKIAARRIDYFIRTGE